MTVWNIKINQDFLVVFKIWVNKRAGTTAQPTGPLSCFNQQSNWVPKEEYNNTNTVTLPQNTFAYLQQFVGQRLPGPEAVGNVGAHCFSWRDCQQKWQWCTTTPQALCWKYWMKYGRENRCLSLQHEKQIKFGEVDEKKMWEMVEPICIPYFYQEMFKFYTYSHIQ